MLHSGVALHIAGAADVTGEGICLADFQIGIAHVHAEIAIRIGFHHSHGSGAQILLVCHISKAALAVIECSVPVAVQLKVMVGQQIDNAALKFGYLFRVIRQQSFAKLAVARIAQFIAHTDNIAEIVKLVNHPLTIYNRHILHNSHHVAIRVCVAVSDIKVFTRWVYNPHTLYAMRHCIRISKFQISSVTAVSNAFNIVIRTKFTGHLRPRNARSFTVSINNPIQSHIVIIFKRYRCGFARCQNSAQHIVGVDELRHTSCTVRNALKPPIAILESIRVAAAIGNAQQSAGIIQRILRTLKAHNRTALILNFGVCAIIRQLETQAGKVFVICRTTIGLSKIMLASVPLRPDKVQFIIDIALGHALVTAQSPM